MKNPKVILCLQGLLSIAIGFAPYVQNGFMDFSMFPFAWHKVIGLSLNIIGFTILVFSIRKLGREFEVQAKPKAHAQLKTDGIYSYSRNPVYLAALLMSLGWSISFRGTYGLLLLPVLYFVLRIKIGIEEKFLYEQFGEPYKGYLKSTPRLFWKL